VPWVLEGNPIGVASTDVFVVRPDGSGLTRVAGGPVNEHSPSFSPDGRRVEFARIGWIGELPEDGWYSVALDGTDERRLTTGFPNRVDYSPDGRYAAYGYRGRLFMMRADGTGLRDVTPPEMQLQELGVWGTAGPAFFFTAMRKDWRSTGVRARIYRVEPGRPAVAITPDGGFASQLDWIRGPGDPNPRFADTSAPAGLFLSAAGSRVLTRRTLSLMATDATGIRRARFAMARRVRGRGAARCRFVGPNGLGRPRACSRPRLIRTPGEGALLSRIRRLRPGRYLVGFRTMDVRGNRTHGLELKRVRLR
jgi:hypothetical protein